MKNLLLVLQPHAQDTTTVADDNTGTIVGIVLFAIVLLAVVIYFIWKKNQNNPTVPPTHDRDVTQKPRP